MRVILLGVVLAALAAGLVAGSLIVGEDGGEPPAREAAEPSAASAQETTARIPREAVELPDGAGRETLRSSCQACHSLASVAVARQNAEDWDTTVTEMEAIGARVPEDGRERLIAYLSEHFGEDVPPAPGPVDPAEQPFGRP